MNIELTENMQKALQIGMFKRWKEKFNLNEIISRLINGEIYIFKSKKQLFEFYKEAELCPIESAKHDIEEGNIIYVDDLFFFIST